MKILILCTGNSCRSQMAHGFMKTIDSRLTIRSAGTKPEKQVNPYAIQVMNELGIDISDHTPHLVDEYISESWDYVITVCDHAKEVCPLFTGSAQHRLHIGFEDPADATGTDEEKLIVYRKIRDQIQIAFVEEFYKSLKLN